MLNLGGFFKNMKKKISNYECNYKLWRRKLGNALLQEKPKVPPRSNQLVVMEGILVMVILMKMLMVEHIFK
jgi:hypothetical protein